MHAAHAEEVLRAGPLEVRPREGLALAAGRPMTLSVREFETLVALARRPERITTREELFAAAWGERLRAGDRSVDVYVRKLRVKLESVLPGWRFIHTHVGFGYRFSPERDVSAAAHGPPALGKTSPSHAFHIPATGS